MHIGSNVCTNRGRFSENLLGYFCPHLEKRRTSDLWLDRIYLFGVCSCHQLAYRSSPKDVGLMPGKLQLDTFMQTTRADNMWCRQCSVLAILSLSVMLVHNSPNLTHHRYHGSVEYINIVCASICYCMWKPFELIKPTRVALIKKNNWFLQQKMHITRPEIEAVSLFESKPLIFRWIIPYS